MKYLVTDIEFDFSEFGDGDPDYQIDEWEQDQITKNNIGVWEASNDDDLIEEITASTGWCIKSINYEVQLK